MGILFNKFGSLLEHEWAGLDKFNLTTLVIHDPADMRFKRLVYREYNELCRRTGDKHLFVSFMSPEFEDWHKASYNPESSVKSMAFEKGMDDERIIYLLCSMLGLENVRPPFLLLTPSIDQKQFYLLPTSSKQLSEHLMMITSFCDMCEENLSVDDPRLQKLVNRMSSCVEYVKSDSSLCELLLSLLAPLNLHDRQSLSYSRAEKIFRTKSHLDYEQIKYGQSELHCSPNQSKRDPHRCPFSSDYTDHLLNDIIRDLHLVSYAVDPIDECDLLQEFDLEKEESAKHELMSKVANQKMYLGLNAQSSSPIVCYDHIPQWMDLEIKTRSYLRWLPLNPQDQGELYLLGMSLALECEMYHSVLQMMRFCVGIEMPTYYLKAELSDRKWLFQRDSFVTNLNEYDKDKNGNITLKPMSLGKMKSCYSQMKASYRNDEMLIIQERFHDFMDDNFDQKFLNGLSWIRNNAMHYTPGFDLTSSRMHQAFDNFNSIVNNHLDEMIQLKKQLRGDASNLNAAV